MRPHHRGSCLAMREAAPARLASGLHRADRALFRRAGSCLHLGGEALRRIKAPTIILGAASLLAVLCTLPTAPPTLAQSDAAPTTCRVGLYLRDLHSFNPTADTFGADLWLWSVCPTADHQPLQTMEFVNSDDVAVLLDVGDEQRWTQRNVDGTFRYDWEERNFPFDRHTLTIEMEEGVEDVHGLVYDPDTANSGVDPELELPGGWRMTGSTLVASTNTYDTTFGDPDLPAGGSSEYSRLTLSIDLERTDLGGFFKLTAVVYAAFFFSLLTYVMHLEIMNGIGARVTLLAIALFATAVNLGNASNALGTASGLTLVDKIHVMVLVYILVAAIVTVISRVLLDRGVAAAEVARLNYRVGAMVIISFGALNA